MPTTQTAPYPLSAARALALHAQALSAPPAPDAIPDANAVYNAIRQIGWLQIDTLQVVRRSQYIALWSRLGAYDPDCLDALLYDGGKLGGDNNRRLYEYWMHAACIIPLDAYRYTLPAMRRNREARSKRIRAWLNAPANRRLLAQVLEHARANGGARSADFRREDDRKGAWWDWKPAKIALEYLYDTGELTIANRVNFQRIYADTDAVLPAWVNRTPPSDEEANLYLLEQSARSLGVCSPAQLPDYSHMKRTPAKPLTQRLLDNGVLIPVKIRLHDDSVADHVVHKDNLPLLDRAADGDLAPRGATFLSPFDSLFWAKDRDAQYWGFQQILEAYKPAPQRIWGYFCLPILHNGALVGRFDPKLDRAAGVLRLKRLHMEPGIEPREDLIAAIAAAMRDFLSFHNATDLAIEHSHPRPLRRKLLAAM